MNLPWSYLVQYFLTMPNTSLLKWQFYVIVCWNTVIFVYFWFCRGLQLRYHFDSWKIFKLFTPQKTLGTFVFRTLWFMLWPKLCEGKGLKCTVSNENDPLRLIIYDYVVPRLWNSLGIIRKCGIIGRNIPLRVGFEILKIQTISSKIDVHTKKKTSRAKQNKFNNALLLCELIKLLIFSFSSLSSLIVHNEYNRRHIFQLIWYL